MSSCPTSEVIDANSKSYDKSSKHQSRDFESVSHDDGVHFKRITQIKEAVLHFEEHMLIISKIMLQYRGQDNVPLTKELRECIRNLIPAYFHFRLGELPFTYVLDYRREIGKAFEKYGVVKMMCDILSIGLRELEVMKSSGHVLEGWMWAVQDVLYILANFSDPLEMVRVSVTVHPELLELLLKNLKDWQGKLLSLKENIDENMFVQCTLSLLHNCASTDENVPRLRELGTIQIVLPYLDAPFDNKPRVSAISTLALLVNEEESELLKRDSHVSIFQLMIQILREALSNDDHKSQGFSVEELTIALGKLARNDANKRLLVERGCLPVLVNILKKGSEQEKKKALHCLWTLSFDEDNQKRMLVEPDLVQMVYGIYKTDLSLKLNCHGILWSLREKLVSTATFQSIGEEVAHVERKTDEPADITFQRKASHSKITGHVMLSYQWANQETILQISENLKSHGIRVWLDVEQMKGSTLEAMAKAVEDSSIVLVAMSQKYKDSNNTRAEAEYAFQKKKDIIPLKMQTNYTPDGWLGLIVGSKLYYDFSGRYTFESRMISLVNEINGILERDVDSPDGGCHNKVTHRTEIKSLEAARPSHEIKQRNQVTTQNNARANKNSILTWTETDIKQWLSKHHQENSPLQHLCGKEIWFLHILKSEAPEYFYQCLESKLHLDTLLEIAQAAEALADLDL